MEHADADSDIMLMVTFTLRLRGLDAAKAAHVVSDFCYWSSLSWRGLLARSWLIDLKVRLSACNVAFRVLECAHVHVGVPLVSLVLAMLAVRVPFAMFLAFMTLRVGIATL